MDKERLAAARRIEDALSSYQEENSSLFPHIPEPSNPFAITGAQLASIAREVQAEGLTPAKEQETLLRRFEEQENLNYENHVKKLRENWPGGDISTDELQKLLSIIKTIEEAQKLLSDNPEWIKRYDDYAKKLLSNIDNSFIKNIRRRFHEFSSLRFYISATRAMKNAEKRLELDLRYRGQSVATLKATSNDIIISTKGKDENNERDFDCTIQLNNVSWKDDKAREFRKKIREGANTRNKTENNRGNEEHNVESLLLTEFSKQKSKEKPICYIQPVKIEGIRFGMPTPLKASDHKKPLKYAFEKGGGIDIFARTGKGRYSTYLTVIEVKDENKVSERPEDALKQAIQYAVFIRELLRSKSGKDWYKIFGFKGNIPEQLTIRVACAMPDDILDTSFGEQSFDIGNDKIECHYIYFKYNGEQLSDFQTSLGIENT